MAPNEENATRADLLADLAETRRQLEWALKRCETSPADVKARKDSQRQRDLLHSQIQQTQKLESLGVLAGGIAHDFNNLLMGILGNAELALQDEQMEASTRASVHEISEIARRAADLCRQMLAYSGRASYVAERIDLNRTIGEISELLARCVGKGVVFNQRLSAGVPEVMADSSQMRQVILNLVTNASEAIGDKTGAVSLTTGARDWSAEDLENNWLHEKHAPGLYVYLEVSDTGCGMQPDVLQRIFDPFFTTKFTGRGLGLAAVLGIVRAHKGAIQIESRPGHGSTFRMLLPAAPDLPGATRLTPGAAGETWKGHGTVLLADDEDTIRSVGARMLQKIGFDMVPAEDGRAAVEAFSAAPGTFAAAILDVTMPRMSGVEAMAKIREIRADVPVILCSGHEERELAERFDGSGADGYLQKPYGLSELSERLRGVLAT